MVKSIEKVKTKLFIFFSLLLSLSFKTDNDAILRSLVKQSESIVIAKVTEQKRCTRMEDGVEECIFSFKVLKIYKSKSIKAESIIEITIMSYACINSDGKMLVVGQELILFLAPESKTIPSLKLTDNWLGVQSYNEAINKYLLENTNKKQ